MTIEEIEMQFAYNEWANGLLLLAAESLPADMQNRDLGASHRSLLGTLFHIVFCEWDWLHFWRGKTWSDIAADEPPETDFPDVATLRPQWTAIVEGQKAFLAELTSEAISKRISYQDFRGQWVEFSLWETIQHLISHSAYHRGQVVTILRQLGQTPPTSDFLLFVQEKRSMSNRGAT